MPKSGFIFLIFFVLSFVMNAQQKQDSIYYEHPAKASGQSKILNLIYKWAGIKQSSARKTLGKGNPMTRPQPIRKIRKKTQLLVDSLEGRLVYYLEPKTNKKDKYILYFHGGAYTESFVKQHWLFMLKLIKATSYTIIAPDYPLAPETKYEENIRLMLKLYQQLGSDYGYDNIILMGDSAGGGLAVALSLAIKDAGLPPPIKMILLSPWLNLKMDHPQIAEIDKKDPMLNLEWVKASALAYAGREEKLSAPFVSPIFGNLEDLATISLFIGGRDMLWPDCEAFRSRVLKEKGTINYYYYPNMVHVWMLVGFLPEAKACFAQIVDELTK